MSKEQSAGSCSNVFQDMRRIAPTDAHAQNVPGTPTTPGLSITKPPGEDWHSSEERVSERGMRRSSSGSSAKAMVQSQKRVLRESQDESANKVELLSEMKLQPIGEHLLSKLKRISSSQRRYHRDTHVEPLILCVDDDAVNHMVLEGFFKPQGFATHMAMDGFEAISFLQETQELPDVILLDVMMPGMSLQWHRN